MAPQYGKCESVDLKRASTKSIFYVYRTQLSWEDHTFVRRIEIIGSFDDLSGLYGSVLIDFFTVSNLEHLN